MAHIVMANMVMVYKGGLLLVGSPLIYGYGHYNPLYSYGHYNPLYSYGPYSYGPYKYGPYSYGLQRRFVIGGFAVDIWLWPL